IRNGVAHRFGSSEVYMLERGDRLVVIRNNDEGTS
ncbi:MAG: hypothetical protein RJB01_325, partial [Actinomycetota bacterium]